MQNLAYQDTEYQQQLFDFEEFKNLKNHKKPQTFFDFCAGIGAGRKGLENANLACVSYAEILEKSENIYQKLHNTKKEKNFGDLTKIDINTLPNFDVLISGFPCQSFSINGKREGFDGESGQIIFYLVEILKEKNVPYFILENVKGLINHDKGQTLKIILEMLDKAGFYVEYKVINSIEFVPQMRERVYFIGIKKELYKKPFNWNFKKINYKITDFLDENNTNILDINNATFQKYLNNKYNSGKFDIQEILKTDYLFLDTRQSDLRIYQEKSPTLRANRHGILYTKNGKLHKLNAYEALLLQGFDKEQARKIQGKITDSNGLFAAGNAMTVKVIENIAKGILEWI